MPNRPYVACLHPVSDEHNDLKPAFLDTLIDAINPLPDAVFERNNKYDVYSVMSEALGPYTDLLHRKAVMCEILRVVAAFESDWNWNEAVDKNNAYSVAHKSGEETGAFQVSWDSLPFDHSLTDCLDRLAGAHDVDTFITSMKTNHALAVEYCARLLRFNTSWCGTIQNPAQVIVHVRRDAVEEFKAFLTLNNPLVPNGIAAKLVVAGNDASHIPALVALASTGLKAVQARAAQKMLVYAGETYPHDGCAITLSLLLQDSGIGVGDVYRAIDLTNLLRNKRNWQVVPVGQQQTGDIGTTCGNTPNHGYDHIYLVLERTDADKMLVADNQQPQPHDRWASGKDRTPTKYFLRAV